MLDATPKPRRIEKSLQKKRGRPAIGRGVQINGMWRPELVDQLDAWIATSDDPRQSRSSAIRRLVEQALARG